MTIGKTTNDPEVLIGDVYRRSRYDAGSGRYWELVLTADGQSVIDDLKLPPDWREQLIQKPWMTKAQRGIFTRLNIS